MKAFRPYTADPTKIRSVESLAVKVRLNGDPRYVANQVARWAVPPSQPASVAAPHPLAFVYLPLRQARAFTPVSTNGAAHPGTVG